jgi:aspartate/glutamate racemase
MKIVDVNIDEMNRVARRGRARSAEMQQLISAMEGLKPGGAKAIVLGSGDTAQKVRARIAYAGRIAGKRVQVAVESDRVLFALSTRQRRRKKA